MSAFEVPLLRRGPAPYTDPGSPTAHVVLYGDSLMAYAEVGFPGEADGTYVTDDLAAEGWAVSTCDVAGLSADEACTLVSAFDLDPIPDVAVIAIGGNDTARVLAGTVTLAEQCAEFDRLVWNLRMQGIGAVAALTMQTFSSGIGADLYGADWNAHVESNPFLDFVEDWGATSDSNQAWFSGDTVHFDGTRGNAAPTAYTNALIAAVNGALS